MGHRRSSLSETDLTARILGETQLCYSYFSCNTAVVNIYEAWWIFWSVCTRNDGGWGCPASPSLPMAITSCCWEYPNPILCVEGRDCYQPSFPSCATGRQMLLLHSSCTWWPLYLLHNFTFYSFWKLLFTTFAMGIPNLICCYLLLGATFSLEGKDTCILPHTDLTTPEWRN